MQTTSKEVDMRATKELFNNVPDWVKTINISEDGLSYGFNCTKEFCYFNDRGYWDFSEGFTGRVMSIYLGSGFEFTGKENSIMEREL